MHQSMQLPLRPGEITFVRDVLGRRRLKRDEIFDALPQYSSRTKEPRPLSSTTKNLYLSTLHGMLNRATPEWDWIDKAPKLSVLPGKPKRIRWVAREEAQRLIDVIRADWLRDLAILGFATGLRRANLLNLESSLVDLVNRRARIHSDQAKAGKSIDVPCGYPQVNRQAPDPRVRPERAPDRELGQRAVATQLRACRHREFSVPRRPPYVGKLARAGRYAAESAHGARRLVEVRDGAALRPPRARSLGGACGSGHNLGWRQIDGW